MMGFRWTDSLYLITVPSPNLILVLTCEFTSWLDLRPSVLPWTYPIILDAMLSLDTLSRSTLFTSFSTVGSEHWMMCPATHFCAQPYSSHNSCICQCSLKNLAKAHLMLLLLQMTPFSLQQSSEYLYYFSKALYGNLVLIYFLHRLSYILCLLWYTLMFGNTCSIFRALWWIYLENGSKLPESDLKWGLNLILLNPSVCYLGLC